MNKQDVNRTQPKGCSTAELDVAIAHLEKAVADIKKILKVSVPEKETMDVINRELKTTETCLTALKFMRLMMEPSDTVIVSAINAYYESDVLEKEWRNAINAAVEHAFKEMQGE